MCEQSVPANWVELGYFPFVLRINNSDYHFNDNSSHGGCWHTFNNGNSQFYTDFGFRVRARDCRNQAILEEAGLGYHSGITMDQEASWVYKAHLMFAKKIFIFLIACFFVLSAVAQQGGLVVTKVMDGQNGEIVVGASMTIQVEKYFIPAHKNRMPDPYPVRNTIQFRLNEDRPVVLPANFQARVKVRVQSKDFHAVTSTIEKELSLNYKGDSVVQVNNQFVFGNAHEVIITVLEMETSADTSIWRSLKLESTLDASHVYDFSCTNDLVTSITLEGLDLDTQSDIVHASWPMVIGASVYDLEWTYIDSFAMASGKYGSRQQLDARMIFDLNSTRVTVATQEYDIPLLYDDKGLLFVRVRPVQLFQDGGRREAVWNDNVLGIFEYGGHEKQLNWQASTSFAEEGKRKSVVQYFDGSLHMRQAVTKDNTTLNTVVTESIYDRQGRPVIQVLPSPTLNNIIGYSRSFNQGINGAGDGYDFSDFDSLRVGDQFCSKVPDAMSNESGAAQYYSPDNPKKNNGIHRFIPDAKGYPFTQVEYTPDKTGRVNRQSGVGEDFKLGSGHETKYFYGSASQEELNALFGTEVGNKSHYFKTMVRDANGQFSISYTDMSGKTIATALAGALPIETKLDSLATRSERSLVEKLSDPSATIIKDLVMENRSSLLVSTPGMHEFRYKLDPATLQLANCQEQNIITVDECVQVGTLVDVVSKMLQFLWDKDIPAIASCPFENELPQKGGYKSKNVPWVNF